MNNVATCTDEMIERSRELMRQVSDITSVSIYFKGAVDALTFQEKLRNGEIAQNECYVVDGDVYIGDILIESKDDDTSNYDVISEHTENRIGQLRSYTCIHCGGSIDSTTMHCSYCGVKYFFS